MMWVSYSTPPTRKNVYRVLQKNKGKLLSDVGAGSLSFGTRRTICMILLLNLALVHLKHTVKSGASTAHACFRPQSHLRLTYSRWGVGTGAKVFTMSAGPPALVSESEVKGEGRRGRTNRRRCCRFNSSSMHNLAINTFEAVEDAAAAAAPYVHQSKINLCRKSDRSWMRVSRTMRTELPDLGCVNSTPFHVAH